MKPAQRETEPIRTTNMFLIVWKRLLKRKVAVFGLCIFLAMVFCAIFADWIAPYDPNYMIPGAQLLAPSWAHPMGTDMLCRDILSRIIYGSRISIYVGIVSMLIAVSIGVPLGLVSGYFGRWVDQLIMRLMDVMLAFPVFLLAIMIMVVLGASATNVCVALGIVYIPRYARIVRGSVLSIRENEYIEAVQALGIRKWRTFLLHLLPNCLAPVLVVLTLSIGVAIIAEASLSFLGMGTQPPTASWGSDLKDAISLMEISPWLAIFPGTAILLTVLGVNMLGDGLRDAIDPRLK
ncbi:MAG: ABC transporter permease [Deltaproteobacteria bacterium]|nr:ABC transporter permease [Deltaproteobacteria bacterium]MBW2065295.1 ABC transporter permease [Deltaproteobacteria bacterium]